MSSNKMRRTVLICCYLTASILLFAVQANTAEDASLSPINASESGLSALSPNRQECGAINLWGKNVRWEPYNEQARLVRYEKERNKEHEAVQGQNKI